MTPVKVSVIVPCYNVEAYLTTCLESLIHQTLKDIEIICVDDGSTDGTLSVLNEYSQRDGRMKVISQPNMKQGAARNNGIRNASGEYIGFVDSDDYVDTDYFERLYGSAKQYNADIAVAGILKHKKTYKKYNIRYYQSSVVNDLTERIRICKDYSGRFFYVFNKLYKNSLLQSRDILFPENRYFEDVWFATAAIYYSNCIVSVPGTLYHYVQRGSSTINSAMTEKKQADYRIAYSKIEEFAKEHNFTLPDKANYYESKWVNLFIKRYRGRYMEKFKLFGLFPILTREIK